MTERDILYSAVIEGVHSASCKQKIELSLLKLKGVKEFKLNLPAKTAVMRLARGKASIGEVEREIYRLGYRLAAFKRMESFSARLNEWKTEKYFHRILFCFLSTFFLFFEQLGQYSPYTKILLSFTVITWGIYPFWVKFFRNLKKLRFDYSYVIVISLTSLFCVLLGAETGEWESTFDFYELPLLAFLFNLGEWFFASLEDRFVFETKRMLSMPAPFIRRLSGGREEIVPSEKLKKGDVILLKEGEISSVDGEIIEGKSEVDESFMGNSEVVKGPMSRIYAGSIVRSSEVKVRAEGLREETLFFRCINALIKNLSSGGRTENILEKIQLFFFVFLLFAFSVLFLGADNLSFQKMFFILSYSGPPILLLIFPIMMKISAGKLKEYGVKINDFFVMWKISSIDKAIIDGDMLLRENSSLADMKSFGISRSDLLNFAFAAAQFSPRSTMKEIVKAARKEDAIFTGEVYVLHQSKSAVEIMMEGKRVILCDLPFLLKSGFFVEKAALVEMENAEDYILAVLVDGRLCGYFLFKFANRKSVRKFVERLNSLEIKPCFVSSQNSHIVRKICGMIHVEDYYSNISKDDIEYIILRRKTLNAKSMIISDDIGFITKGDVGFGCGDTVFLEKYASVFCKGRAALFFVPKTIFFLMKIRKDFASNVLFSFALNAVALMTSLSFFNFHMRHVIAILFFLQILVVLTNLKNSIIEEEI